MLFILHSDSHCLSLHFIYFTLNFTLYVITWHTPILYTSLLFTIHYTLCFTPSCTPHLLRHTSLQSSRHFRLYYKQTKVYFIASHSGLHWTSKRHTLLHLQIFFTGLLDVTLDNVLHKSFTVLHHIALYTTHCTHFSTMHLIALPIPFPYTLLNWHCTPYFAAYCTLPCTTHCI